MGRIVVGFVIIGLFVAVGAALMIIGGAVFKGVSSNKAKRAVRQGVEGYSLKTYSAQYYGRKVVPAIAKEDFQNQVAPALADNTPLDQLNLDFSKVFVKHRLQVKETQVASNHDNFAQSDDKSPVGYSNISPDEWGELYRLYLDSIESHIKEHTRLQTSLRKVDDGKADRVLKKAESNRRALEELRSHDGEWDFLVQKKKDEETA